MYKCIPLFVPSNLGETELSIGISPSHGIRALNPVELRGKYKKDGKECSIEGYHSFIWVNSVVEAQKAVIELSRQLEKCLTHSIQSDRLYFLPLFDQIGYNLIVTPNKPHQRPVIRVACRPQHSVWTWKCAIYTSNLVQLQEALFSHERNLLKKRLLVLEQQGAKNGKTD